jgi:endonuclease YncB( thermonuclease family)
MRLLVRLLQWVSPHRRLTWFWALAAIGLILPWMMSCESPLTHLSRQEQPCTLQSIHDGDTLRLTCNGEHLQVRLYCIDAPELEQKPWGQESRNHLRAITPKRVLLIAHDQDRYGRTVGEVITDDPDRENLNLAQVRSGNAAVYRSFCEGDAYYQAEREAKRIRAGIWERAGDWQRPWEHRKG